MSGDNEWELLRGMFAPFDAKAWERFREWDPEAAAYLVDGVQAGIADETICDYGQAFGYSPNAVSWLVHAAAYVRRTMAPAAETGGETEARPLRRMTDGPVETYGYATTAAEAVTRYIAGAGTTGAGALRPPARTKE